MTIAMPACASCGLAAFPPHLRCARCGSLEWATIPVLGGTLEGLTVVRRSLALRGSGLPPPTIVVVVTDAGPRVIALLVNDAESAQTGAAVTLTQNGMALLATTVNAEPAAQGSAQVRP